MDFNGSMERLIAQACVKIEPFKHIRIEQVLVSATFNRSPRRAGLLAYVLPLKYRAGSPIERRVRGGREFHWAMLPVHRRGVEILYIIYFMLPRFLQQGLREKLETVIHELYHISPEFNGDLRRFRGRSALHGSHKAYDNAVREMTDLFLRTSDDPLLYAFLSQAVDPLLVAQHVPEPRPKLLKVAQYPSRPV